MIVAAFALFSTENFHMIRTKSNFSQAAFLSALVGVEVAEAAARAAVASLSDVDPRKMKEGLGSFANGARIQGTDHFLWTSPEHFGFTHGDVMGSKACYW